MNLTSELQVLCGKACLWRTFININETLQIFYFIQTVDLLLLLKTTLHNLKIQIKDGKQLDIHLTVVAER